MGALSGLLIAGSASAGIVQSPAGVYTYSGNGYNFFSYNTNLGTGLNSDTWAYNQVSLLNGTRSNNEHFQQYPGGANPELMDGNYTHGANNNNPDWTDPDPYPGGDGNNALTTQPWDNEQLFWNFIGDSTGGTLHIGIVTGFNSAGIDGWDAGDLFLSFGTSTTPLPNSGESGGANATDGFYQLAIGTGNGRNTGSNEWILPGTWVDIDSNPFDVESDPYRYGDTNAQTVDIADVEWTQGNANNKHNFLAVAIDLTGQTAWLEALLGVPGGAAGGFTVHWTYECGNDTVHHTALTTTPYDNIVPVPAAAPRALVGMLALGLVRRMRAKK
jgi:hypothetical protein